MRNDTGATKLRRKGAAHRLVRPALVAILLSGTVLSTPFLMPAFAQSYSFSNVVIEGNVSVDAATILAYAGIGRGQSVSGGE